MVVITWAIKYQKYADFKVNLYVGYIYVPGMRSSTLKDNSALYSYGGLRQ